MVDLKPLAATVSCAKCHSSLEVEGMPPKEHQEFVAQQFFADPIQWWDNRRSKTTPRHPVSTSKSNLAMWLYNWHKPGLLDLQLATWDSDTGMKGPMSVEGLAAFGRLELYDDHMEVTMCRKLCEAGRITDAVQSLNLQVQRGCRIPNNLFYRVLKLCITHKDLALGTCVHELAVRSGYEGDAFLATHLIGLYAWHGRLDEAMRVFTKVPEPDAYNWATIIFAYVRHGEAAEAIRLYRQMLESSIVRPNNHIYVAVLKACATAGDLLSGQEVHSRILATPGEPNNFVQAGLVHMYANCGSLGDAHKVFDALPQKRDVVTWTAMIAGYSQQGMGQEALSLYSGMQQDGLSPPDSVTFMCLLQACANVGAGALRQGKQLHAQIEERGLQGDVILGGSLVNMYAKCGSLEDACSVFHTIRDKNVVTWTAMIAGYAQHGMGQEALTLYNGMEKEGITAPNRITFVCLLQACAIVATLPLGKQLHAQIEERGLQGHPVVGAALVNMYAKCGSMFDSQMVFDSLPERTIEAWNALAAGYTRQGDSEIVFDLVDKMSREGIQPDSITFLSVLTVCSHVGLVAEGRKYFESMRTDYGIGPTMEQHICMMDLLGRAGHVDEALEMAKTMPFPPDGSVWRTLLGACLKWKNTNIGQQAFELAVSVDGMDAASYVLMSNIYASAEMWEEAKEMQERRLKLGAWKKPGQSWWTDKCGVVHTFVVGNKDDPHNEGWNMHSPN